MSCTIHIAQQHVRLCNAQCTSISKTIFPSIVRVLGSQEEPCGYAIGHERHKVTKRQLSFDVYFCHSAVRLTVACLFVYWLGRTSK